MPSPKLGAFRAISLALSFGSLRALGSDKSVSIETVPPGAQVEVNGSVACATPCSIKVPAYYFGKKRTALSSHGVQPVRVTLTKQGYVPKTVDLTTGPIQWHNLYGDHIYDYYLMTSEHFTFQLEAAGAAPVTAPAAGPKPVAPPSLPAIVLASPSGVSPNQTVEFSESPLVIRGVATDSTGILVVAINGSAANMRPQNAQAAEFWSDPLALQPGGNRIEITATNSAHTEAKVVFLVHYTPKAAPPNPRALDKQDILSLLKGGVPTARVVVIIKDRGIKFVPTAGDLKNFRAAGGNEELIQIIQQAAPPK
jgi:hypothetical protein